MIMGPWLRAALLALLAVLLSPVAVVAAAGAASAHTELVETAPADGASLDVPAAEVVLTFTDEVVALGTEVAVTGPDGPVAVTGLTVEGRTVRATLDTTTPAGAYTADWRASAQDGHPITGRATYSVLVGADGAGAEAAPEGASGADREEQDAAANAMATDQAALDDGRSVPLVAWVIVGAVVLVAAGGLVSRRGRKPL